MTMKKNTCEEEGLEMKRDETEQKSNNNTSETMTMMFTMTMTKNTCEGGPGNEK